MTYDNNAVTHDCKARVVLFLSFLVDRLKERLFNGGVFHSGSLPRWIRWKSRLIRHRPLARQVLLVFRRVNGNFRLNIVGFETGCILLTPHEQNLLQRRFDPTLHLIALRIKLVSRKVLQCTYFN